MSVVRPLAAGLALCAGTNAYAVCDGLNGARADACMRVEIASLQADVAKLTAAFRELSTDVVVLRAESEAADAVFDDLIVDHKGELVAQDARLAAIEGDYVQAADLAGFATRQWVTSQDYAATKWVEAQGYATAADLGAYVTADWVEAQDYVTRDALASKGYATTAWVEAQGYGEGIPYLADYLTVNPDTNAVFFTGANVYVQDGSGNTPCGTFGFEDCSGTGNLIVGYNEAGWAPVDQQIHGFDRTGSHNLVTGRYHDYESFGGVLAGYGNRVEASEGTVLGGVLSTVSAPQATIIGGEGTLADIPREIFPFVSDLDAVVDVTDTDVFVEGANLHVRNGSGSSLTANGTGNLFLGYDEHAPDAAGSERDASGALDATDGSHNLVIGDYHSYGGTRGIVGGHDNTLVGSMAVVATGYRNAADSYTFIGSGQQNSTVGSYQGAILTGFQNTATGDLAAVVGGSHNLADGASTVVVGGDENTASGDGAVVVGGLQNGASGGQAVVGGGQQNHADGFATVVAGGWSHIIWGDRSAALGGAAFWDSGITGTTFLGGIGVAPSSANTPEWSVFGLGQWGGRIEDLEDVVFP